jgi:hypothetical protein
MIKEQTSKKEVIPQLYSASELYNLADQLEYHIVIVV